MNSSLYRGRVRHRRRGDAAHEFDYSLFLVCLDLDEAPRAFDGRMLWSWDRANAVCVLRRDLLGDPARPLADCVREEVAKTTGAAPQGPVRVLTMPRCWGWVFNPVTFYYCYDTAGASVETIVAEITNTPWLERHRYVLHRGIDERSDDAPVHRYRFAKSFHVSPFLPMDLSYDWRFSDPSDTLAVHMDVLRGADPVFDATLTMTRHPLDGPSCAAALASHPWMSAKAVLGIYWNAFRLWTKRAPFHTHPAKLAAGAPR